jgi:hypothetical protein
MSLGVSAANILMNALASVSALPTTLKMELLLIAG